MPLGMHRAPPRATFMAANHVSEMRSNGHARARDSAIPIEKEGANPQGPDPTKTAMNNGVRSASPARAARTRPTKKKRRLKEHEKTPLVDHSLGES